MKYGKYWEFKRRETWTEFKRPKLKNAFDFWAEESEQYYVKYKLYVHLKIQFEKC